MPLDAADGASELAVALRLAAQQFVRPRGDVGAAREIRRHRLPHQPRRLARRDLDHGAATMRRDEALHHVGISVARERPVDEAPCARQRQRQIAPLSVQRPFTREFLRRHQIARGRDERMIDLDGGKKPPAILAGADMAGIVRADENDDIALRMETQQPVLQRRMPGERERRPVNAGRSKLHARENATGKTHGVA